MDDPNGERTRLGFDWTTIYPNPTLQPLDPRHTALMCIDLQYRFIHPDYGNVLAGKRGGLDVTGFLKRINDVLPRVRMLQDLCRSAGLEVIHTRIEALTKDGRDIASIQREKAGYVPRGSFEAQILPEVAPVGDEIVFVKATSSVFSTTHVNTVLRILGIDTLILCGVATNGCVELSARDAADRGYRVIPVSDCCGAWSIPAHEDTLERLARGASGILVRTADEVAEMIRAARPVSVA